MNERFYILLSRKLSHEANIQELEELERLILSDPECHDFINRIEHLSSNKRNIQKGLDAFDAISWELQDDPFGPKNNLKDEAASTKLEPSFTGKHRNALFAGAVAAAAVLVFFVMGVFSTKEGDPLLGAHNEVVTSRGQKSHLTLSDGTKVWLNADSKLLYPENFSGSTREVKLIGEAFFDVSHDKQKPFIIHTRDMKIKVLGTRFNVKAYPNEMVSEAALIKGSIEVSFTKRPNQNLILKPNEKIQVVNADFMTNKKSMEKPLIHLDNIAYDVSDSTIVETAWTKGRLVFNAETFGEIAALLGRQFDVNIIIEKTEMMDKTFTASFENESIDEILSLLKMTYQFEFAYDRKNKTIRIL